MTHQKIQIRQLIIGLVLLGATVAYFVLFGSKGVINNALNVSVVGKKWFVVVTLKYLLGILLDAALIWCLMAMGNRSLKLATAFRYYLLVWLGGVGVLLFLIITTGAVGHYTVYDQLFFVTRGALTSLAAGFWLLLGQPWLQQMVRRDWVVNLAAGLIWLPLVFHRDLFAFGNGLSLSAIFILGFAAVMLLQGRRLSRHWLWLVPLGLVATLLLGRFEQTIFIMHVTNAPRFIGLTSPLTVFPAVLVVQYARRFATASDQSAKRIRLAIWLAPVMLAEGNYAAVSGKLIGFWRHTFRSLGLFWLIIAVLLLMATLLLIASLAWFTVRRLSIWSAIEANWQVSLAVGVSRLRQWPNLIKTLWQRYSRPLTAFIGLFIVQIAATLLMNQTFQTVEYMYRPHLNIFGWMFAYQLPRMLAGTLVLLALYWLLLAISNRYWLSLVTVAGLTVLFAIANRVKLGLRDAPIAVADLTELKQLPELLHMVSPWLLAAGALVIIGLIALIWRLELHSANANQSIVNRGLKGLIAVVFLLSLGQLNHAYSPTRNLLTAFSVDAENTNPTRYAQWNGPVLQFVSGFDVQVMAKPAGYSQRAMNKLVARYQTVARKLNRTRTATTADTTVLFNLSESFADPTRLPGLTFNADPIPYIHQLMKTTTSGGMMSFGYGGGTADMEYMTLTGMSLGAYDTSLNTPYTQLVPTVKTAPNIGNDFGLSTAIHPYTGGFYNRPAVYKKFQFSAFKYLGSRYPIYDQRRFGHSPYLSDQTAYANALRQIKAHAGGQFINLISIQNHMPYSNWYPNNSVTVKNSGQLGVPTSSLTTYAQGLKYTDSAVKKFRQELDQLKRPVVWVFYGDHLPGIYSGWTNQVLMHTTDYFVYANRYARQHGAKLKLAGTRYVGPDNFIALALKQGNVKVNAYQALLTAVQEQLPAQWIKLANARTNSTTGVRFIGEQGQSIRYAKLTTKQKQLYHDYQLVLYDLNAGKQYSLRAGLRRSLHTDN